MKYGPEANSPTKLSFMKVNKNRQESEGVVTVKDDEGQPLALIVKANSMKEHIRFVTPHSFQQQVAIMNRPKYERIPGHYHLPVPRALQGTHEVLILLEGSMILDIFDSMQKLVRSESALAGDVIVLMGGGHGFTMNDDCRIIEVKQGPYVPGKDKVIFENN